MRFKQPCPHCRGRVVARDSYELTPTMREIVFQCTNPKCSFSFVSTLEAVRALNISGSPNPNIKLPLSERVRDRVMQQLELLA